MRSRAEKFGFFIFTGRFFRRAYITLSLDITWYPNGMFGTEGEELVINQGWNLRNDEVFEKTSSKSFLIQGRPKGPFKDLEQQIDRLGTSLFEYDHVTGIYKETSVGCSPQKK